MLFHNAALHTPQALPTIIESLQKDGYKIVPVSELILKDNYTIDNAGMQKPLETKTENDNTETKETFLPILQRG